VGFAYSLQLNITVQDKDGDALDNTTVEILKANQVVASKDAIIVKRLGVKEMARAEFTLDPGAYFVRLKRGIYYPIHVYQTTLKKSTEINYVMIQNMPTYSIYGKILDANPQKWIGQMIYVIDNNDAKAREAKVQEEGYYVISAMAPGVQYRLKMGEGNDRKISAPFTYNEPGAYYLEMNMSQEIFVEQKEAISAPTYADQLSKINVFIRKGDVAVAGAQIKATTPAGQLTITTNENGMASVQAASAGNYSFEYKDLIASTIVSARYETLPQVIKPVEQEPNETQVQPQTQSPAPASNNTLLFGAGIAGLVIGSAIVLGIIVVGLIAYFLLPKKGKKEKGKDAAHKK